MSKRRSLSFALLALASVLTSCSSCEAPVRDPEEAPREPIMAEQSFRLPNGLAVDLVSGPCGDQAAVVVLFGVGADHDPAGRSGMAHLVERAMSGAAEGQERLVALGTDHTLISSVVASERLSDELGAVATRMARLELTDADLGRARTEVLEDLTNRHGGDATLTATSFAAESVHPSRGNGWRGGIAEEVQAIDLAALDAFRQAHLTPGNARLVVVGRFDPAILRARIEAVFASLPAGTPPALRDAGDSTVTGTLVMGDAPAAIAVAVRAPAPSEPLYPAFLILAARLTDETADAWTASYEPLAQPELLFVTGPVQPGEQPESTAGAVRNAVARVLGRPLAPADVAAARERFGALLGSGELDPAICTEDPRRLAIARARRAHLGLGELSLADALEATTPEQLALAATLFDARRTAAVIAGGSIR